MLSENITKYSKQLFYRVQMLVEYGMHENHFAGFCDDLSTWGLEIIRRRSLLDYCPKKRGNRLESPNGVSAFYFYFPLDFGYANINGDKYEALAWY